VQGAGAKKRGFHREGEHQLGKINALGRVRSKVLEDEDVVVAVVCLLPRTLRGAATIASMEIAGAPANAMGFTARLFAGRVVLVDLPVKLLDLLGVVLVVRPQGQRVRLSILQREAKGARVWERIGERKRE